MGKPVTFKRPDGKSVDGYLAGEKGPESSSSGMVGHERPDQRRSGQARRRRLPRPRADLYRGKATVDAKEAEHLMKGLNGDAAGRTSAAPFSF
jgi:carboxymethylenebutenolidase